MNEIDLIHAAYSTLAKQTGQVVHREDHYTTALFALLWPNLGARMSVATGLGLGPMLTQIGDSKADELRKRYLPKTKDFYADLVLTGPIGKTAPISMCGLDHFADYLPVTHLFEFKYLSSFKSMTRKHARADGYKLKILGDYIRAFSGKQPYLEQVIFNFRHPEVKQKTVEQITTWFKDDEYRRETAGVSVLVVNADGILHTINRA